jgi:two-component system nitrogen regulation sensor histidine kinase NtrY
MPKPLFRNNNLVDLINNNIELLNKTDESINITLIFSKNVNLNFNCDYEQISRAIFNLIKNSIESIQEKALKIGTFDKKINIEIKRINNYIAINIFDNGIGFLSVTTKELIKPYYTTKKKGSGLGLSIVNKIINDHNGTIEFNSDASGTNIIINLHIK